MSSSVIQLKCSCNNYPWGKKGRESLAARLCEKTPSDFKVDDNKEYSEMWMGTYPTSPSYVLSTGENLQDVINANAEKLVGKKVLDKFGKDLPFLPKILSIAKALPLQIHPSKPLATALHKSNPEQFTDPNHKPEIAVALTKFEVFVNFKPLAEIESLVKQLEPLKPFRPEEEGPFTSESLKRLCKSFLTASDSQISDTITSLSSLPASSFPESQSHIPSLLPRLSSQYTTSDPGTLIALITMNYLVLQPGEAIYVPADGLHAYLSGDIVECMARSNNVLNTGFCPRAQRDDVDVFVESLSFQPGDEKGSKKGEEALLVSRQDEKGRMGRTRVYSPPLGEFDMLVTRLGVGQREVVSAVEGPSVLFVTEGKGRMRAKSGGEGGEGGEWDVKEGYVFFVGKGVELSFDTEESGEGLVVYRAFAE